MLSQEVAKKYARALFQSVKEKGLLNEANEQLSNLRKLLEKDNTLLHFLSAPQVLDKNKLSLIRDVFGSRLERLFVEFIIVLMNKNRIGFLGETIDEFIRLVEAEQGLGRVTVITAVPLDNSERTELSERMAVKTNLKIVLEEKVDASIIGGMIIILHNEIVDGSVRHELNLLNEQLGRARVY